MAVVANRKICCITCPWHKSVTHSFHQDAESLDISALFWLGPFPSPPATFAQIRRFALNSPQGRGFNGSRADTATDAQRRRVEPTVRATAHLGRSITTQSNSEAVELCFGLRQSSVTPKADLS
jgi:hypothetical protein